MRTVSTAVKFARPARQTRGSKYDELLDAGLQVEDGKGVVETYDSPEEAKRALNGIRGRRGRRGLVDQLDVYIAADNVSLVVTPAVPDEVEEASADAS